MTIKVRIAPSPTGYMHIGTARTALFNYLYARNTGGQFLLRIEDTDRERSTTEAVDALIRGMKWLGLDWDGEVIFQFPRAARHAEVAHEMLKAGQAYYCYATPEELEAMRAEQKANGQPTRYDGRWRDRDPSEAPAGVKPVVRLKAPQTGATIVKDHVLGEVSVENAQLDDMVLLRGDGSPTYMLAVVVDDYDMGITHVIRGNDHFTNTFRQIQIYQAMGWPVPEYAHIPMINGEDGKKLSKRHGAVGLHEYEAMGYLPEAVRNYLLRLGWSHGDDEIISDAQAIAWFNLDSLQKSPARFDTKKLRSLNAHYIREAADERLLSLIQPLLQERTGQTLTAEALARVNRGMASLKPRAETLLDLVAGALVYVTDRPSVFEDKASALLDAPTRDMLQDLTEILRGQNEWIAVAIEEKVRVYAESKGLKLGKVAQPLRVALTGTTVSPPIFEVAEILGREECLKRLSSLPQKTT
jgi:glutamyl-tRNA synthetase